MPRTLRSVQAVLALARARDLRELRLAGNFFFGHKSTSVTTPLPEGRGFSSSSG